MAKRRKQVEVPLTRKQLSRREKEERRRRLILLAAGGLFLLIIGILGFGIFKILVLEPASPAAVVNGVAIRTDDYRARVSFERFQTDQNIQQLQAWLSSLDPTKESDAQTIAYLQQQMASLQAQMDQLDYRVLETMIETELLRQEAGKAGVTVTAEEVDRAIEQSFGYTEPTTEATPEASEPITSTESTMTRAEFEASYSAYLNRLKETGLSERTFRSVVWGDLLLSKMQERVTEGVPVIEPFVHLCHIVAKTEAEANTIRARLVAGADFATLAKEVSIDEATKETGGDMGWLPYDGRNAPVFDVAFQLEVGEISQIIQTTQGYEILLLEGKEDRELDPTTLWERKYEAFYEWLSALKASAKIERLWRPVTLPSATLPPE